MRPAAVRSAADLAGSGDPVLVERARQGDEAAVRTIVQRHNRRLYRVARAVLRNDSEAEDVVQETYVRAFTSLGSFRGDSALSTWLTRIALNEALGRVRRRRSTTGLEAAEAEGGSNGACLIMFPSSPSSATPETELARGQVRALLEQAVDELPEPFRVVFILREIEDMSTEETAMHLSIRSETVKTRLHRARRLLRTALDKRLSSAFSELFPFGGMRCERMADRVIQRLREQPVSGA